VINPYRFYATTLIAIAVLSLTPSANHAQIFIGNVEVPEELPLALPAAPLAANLLAFEVPLSNYVFAIDSASISVGADRVARMTVVATSPSGARNVSYEGIRCANSERRVYAFGKSPAPGAPSTPDAAWSVARGAATEWGSLRTGESANYQLALGRDVVCDVRAPFQPAEIIRRLRLLQNGQGARLGP
jgi:CNP1-like family